MAEPFEELSDAMLVTEAEDEALVRALASGQRAFTTKDLVELTEWVQETRLRSALLSLALKGRIGLSIHKGEVIACPPGQTHHPKLRRLHD